MQYLISTEYSGISGWQSGHPILLSKRENFQQEITKTPNVEAETKVTSATRTMVPLILCLNVCQS
jgi:hypothetical protein